MRKMATWAWVLGIFAIAIVKLLVSCPPTFVADWFVGKFEVHPKLDEENVTVNIDGKYLEGDEKRKVINEFNKAIFLEKYYVHPEKSGTPLIIDAKIGKKDARFMVYRHKDHIDVFKQDNKKTVAYSLYSESFQKNPVTI